jgi:hypothetical protein
VNLTVAQPREHLPPRTTQPADATPAPMFALAAMSNARGGERICVPAPWSTQMVHEANRVFEEPKSPRSGASARSSDFLNSQPRQRQPYRAEHVNRTQRLDAVDRYFALLGKLEMLEASPRSAAGSRARQSLLS